MQLLRSLKPAFQLYIHMSRIPILVEASYDDDDDGDPVYTIKYASL